MTFATSTRRIFAIATYVVLPDGDAATMPVGAVIALRTIEKLQAGASKKASLTDIACRFLTARLNALD